MLNKKVILSYKNGFGETVCMATNVHLLFSLNKNSISMYSVAKIFLLYCTENTITSAIGTSSPPHKQPLEKITKAECVSKY